MTTPTTATFGDTTRYRQGVQQRAIGFVCAATVSFGILLAALGVSGTGQSPSAGDDGGRPAEASQPVAVPVPAPPPGN
jgi:hypothetical protein